MQLRRLIGNIVSGGVLVAGCAGAQAVDKGSIPPTKGPTVPALDGKLTVPQGFKVAVFADSVRGARFMALGPDGAVYVSQQSGGNVLRLIDRNGDGIADARSVVLSGLRQPHGMAFHNGWLYVATLNHVYRVKLDANGAAIGTPEELNTYAGRSMHITRTIVFGADNMMYVAIGSDCNVCVEATPDLAAVMQYDENGKNGKVFSSGLRNAVGVAVHPTTHDVWVTQNERDNILPDHQNLPSEEINILKDGGHFGWPFCHDDGVPNPEFKDSTAFCAKTISPALKLQGHTAPLGITFLDRATQFPADYRGDALVALHGSWNRDVAVGSSVVRIHIANGKPTGYEEFVTGWLGDGGAQRTPLGRWGRPVDVMVYKDGSVLISDDTGGKIYRVYR
jgi:glucose/arabinose dehydrogenase